MGVDETGSGKGRRRKLGDRRHRDLGAAFDR
jgi:hypothetical protein